MLWMTAQVRFSLSYHIDSHCSRIEAFRGVGGASPTQPASKQGSVNALHQRLEFFLPFQAGVVFRSDRGLFTWGVALGQGTLLKL